VEDRISIDRFVRAIRRLPSDAPKVDPEKWYKTQKQHWLGWLSEYNGPGAYGRKTGMNRDAKYAYNHIVEPRMLLWLIAAAGLRSDLVNTALLACARAATPSGKSASIRKHVSWSKVACALWRERCSPSQDGGRKCGARP
jgi:hypothetical protein